MKAFALIFLLGQALAEILFSGDDQPRPPLGINLGPVDHEMSQWVFTNRFKHAKEWVPIASSDGWKTTRWSSQFETTWSSDGYPIWFNQNSGSTKIGYMSVLGTSGLYPTGDYIVTFSGTGNITLLGDASNLKYPSPNRAEFTVVQASTRGIILVVTQPNVTNIDLREKNDQFLTSTFSAKFLDALKPFELLRFTPWMIRGYSRDPLVNFDWSGRRPATFYTQTGVNMVSVEYIVELANLLDKNIWISIPNSANDAYMRNMSDFIKKNFNSNRLVYVEQNSDKGFNKNEPVLQMNVISQFKKMFGNENPRVKYVLSTWLGAYFDNTVNKYSENDLKQFDAFSIGGDIAHGIEFNSNSYNSTKSLNFTIEDILEKIYQQIQKEEISLNHLRHKTFIKLKIPLIGYNVGFSVHAPGFASRFRKLDMSAAEQRLEDLIIEALRHPMVEDLFLDFMQRWYKSGAGLMVLNNLVEKVDRCVNGGGRCGYRSLLENLNQDLTTVPKYAAALKWINGNKGRIPFTSDDLPKEKVVLCHNCKWGTCHLGECICFDGYSGPECDKLSKKYLDCASNKTEYSVNLNGIPDWSTELTFIDLHRRAREWIGHKTVYASRWGELTNMLNQSQFRPDGYPKYLKVGQMVGTFVTRDLKSHYPNGDYVCTYDGDGVLEFWFDDNLITKRSAGRIEFTVTHKTEMNNGIYYNILRTNPSNPIRNVKIFEKRYETIHKSFPFQPSFLEFLRKFSTIRFMSWSNVNQDLLVDWPNRTTDDYYTFRLKTGISLEKQVLLCNTLGSNPWFNLPHRATDTYIEKWAEYVRDNLRDDVKVYIEVGNECWGLGGIHECGNYAQKMGYSLDLSLNSNPGNKYPKDLIYRVCYHASTGKRYLDIVKQVFGQRYNRDRIRLVLNTQAAWSWPLEVFYLCKGDFYLHYDVIAIAPYMSSSLRINKTLVDVDEFYEKLADQSVQDSFLQLNRTFTIVKSSAPFMQLALYEAGPDFSALKETWNTNLTELSYKIHRDKRMYQLLRSYLNNMTQRVDLKIYSHFYSVGSYSKYGCWGLLESSDSDHSQSPKFQAYMDHIDEQKVCDWNEKESVCNLNCSQSGKCSLNVMEQKKNFCNCNFGSMGDYCEKLNYIKSERCTYKCGGQGVCSYNHTEGFYLIHTCKCNQGYSGYGCGIFSCEKECNYNGKCIDKDVCSCFRGFKGKFCDIDCGCNGHGVCSTDTNECVCDSGYTLRNTTCAPISLQSDLSRCPICHYGSCVKGKCRCWAGYKQDADKSCTVKTTANNDGSKIGINLNGVVDWSTQWAFVDLSKQARYWIIQHADNLNTLYIWNLEEPISLRPDRYPAFIPKDRKLVTLMLRDVKQKWPNGVYHVFYDGEGFLDFGMDAKLIDQTEKFKMKINVTLSLIRDNGIFMKIQKSNPTNPIRNIRIVMDGYQDIYEQEPFHQLFLERLSHFKTIRFMPWTEENGIIDWSDRTTPETFSHRKGVAYEYQIKLCNKLKTNGWFTVPYEASDNFVLNMARLIRQELRKDVNVYIEYTNEAWNNFFDSGKYCAKMGLEQNLSEDSLTAKNLYYSKRSVEIIKIFKSVFGEEEKRLILVLGSFTLMPVISSRILEYNKAYESHSNIMLAITGYISCGSPKAIDVVQLNFDQLFEKCDQDLEKMNSTIKQHYDIAKKYKVDFGMYESGSGLMELSVILKNQETPGATDKYIEWNRRKEMYKVYKDYYKMFDLYNMSANCHFANVDQPSRYGSWFLLEHQNQSLSTAHRYRAIMDIIEETRTLN